MCIMYMQKTGPRDSSWVHSFPSGKDSGSCLLYNCLLQANLPSFRAYKIFIDVA
jgi:hypothetical protein